MSTTFRHLVEAERRRAKAKALTRDVIFAALLALLIGAVIGLVWGMLI